MTRVIKLVDRETGAEVNVGDKRKCHNEEAPVVVTGHCARTGRVFFELANGYNVRTEGGKFPSVIGTKIVKEEK
tara:strand:- start:1145 stop:1366 length:222 start_codon:yes stop_codon:yes gene_type:complete